MLGQLDKVHCLLRLVNYRLIPSFLPSTGNDARLGWALNLFGDHFAKELEPQQGSMQMLDGFRL